MCAKVPHGRHDLLSEAGQQGKEGLSKVGAANYGEENTWREDDKDQKEGKHLLFSCSAVIFQVMRASAALRLDFQITENKT